MVNFSQKIEHNLSKKIMILIDALKRNDVNTINRYFKLFPEQHFQLFEAAAERNKMHLIKHLLYSQLIINYRRILFIFVTLDDLESFLRIFPNKNSQREILKHNFTHIHLQLAKYSTTIIKDLNEYLNNYRYTYDAFVFIYNYMNSCTAFSKDRINELIKRYLQRKHDDIVNFLLDQLDEPFDLGDECIYNISNKRILEMNRHLLTDTTKIINNHNLHALQMIDATYFTPQLLLYYVSRYNYNAILYILGSLTNKQIMSNIDQYIYKIHDVNYFKALKEREINIPENILDKCLEYCPYSVIKYIIKTLKYIPKIFSDDMVKNLSANNIVTYLYKKRLIDPKKYPFIINGIKYIEDFKTIERIIEQKVFLSEYNFTAKNFKILKYVYEKYPDQHYKVSMYSNWLVYVFNHDIIRHSKLLLHAIHYGSLTDLIEDIQSRYTRILSPYEMNLKILCEKNYLDYLLDMTKISDQDIYNIEQRKKSDHDQPYKYDIYELSVKKSVRACIITNTQLLGIIGLNIVQRYFDISFTHDSL